MNVELARKKHEYQRLGSSSDHDLVDEEDGKYGQVDRRGVPRSAVAVSPKRRIFELIMALSIGMSLMLFIPGGISTGGGSGGSSIKKSSGGATTMLSSPQLQTNNNEIHLPKSPVKSYPEKDAPHNSSKKNIHIGRPNGFDDAEVARVGTDVDADDTTTPDDEQGSGKDDDDDDASSSVQQEDNPNDDDDDGVNDDKAEQNEVDEELLADDGDGVESDDDDGVDDDNAEENEVDEDHLADGDGVESDDDDGVGEDKAEQKKVKEDHLADDDDDGDDGVGVESDDDDGFGDDRAEQNENSCVNKQRDLGPFATYPEWVGYRLGDCAKICAGCPVDSADLVPPDPRVNPKHQQSLAPTLSHNATIAGIYWDLGCEPDGPRLHSRGGNITLLNQIIDSMAHREGFYIPDPDAIVIHLRLGDKVEDSDSSVKKMLFRGADPGRGTFQGLRAIKSLYELMSNVVDSGATEVVIRGGSLRPEPYLKSKIYANCIQEAFEEAGYDTTMSLDEGDADVDFNYIVNARKIITSLGGFSRFLGHLVLKRGGIVYGVNYKRPLKGKGEESWNCIARVRDSIFPSYASGQLPMLGGDEATSSVRGWIGRLLYAYVRYPTVPSHTTAAD
eukprot:scaffold7832_cov164-Amphora_coffeaeformis.AAC.3